MKKKISDYNNGKYAVRCNSAEEFDAIARLIRPDHFAIGKYMVSGYDTIGIYSQGGCGWNTYKFYIKSNMIVLKASDFLEEEEDVLSLFIN